MEIRSDFRHPPLAVTRASLEAHFASDVGLRRAPLRNPHHEPKVTAERVAGATPAAVLLPFVERDDALSILLTRRGSSISFAGHTAFPGGRADPGDSDPEHTALRETEEEIGLAPAAVSVLGRLGDYVTQSGYRITPVVGWVEAPLDLTPDPREVDAIFEIPVPLALDARSYRLRRRAGTESAHFFLAYEGYDVAGPTVSLLINLIEELGKTHVPAPPR